MKVHFINIVAVVVALLTVVACGKKAPEQTSLPQSKGLPCELLVVCDPELTQGDLGDSVNSVVDAGMPAVNGDEPMFRLIRIGTSGYSSMFSVMHSQVFFKIDPEVGRGGVSVRRNVKAAPQIEVTVVAPTPDAMRLLISERRQQIQHLLCDFQVERLRGQLKKKFSGRVDRELRQTVGYSAHMPSDMTATKRGTDFLWAGTNREVKDMNFVFYIYPWDGTPVGDTVRFVMHRDSVLRLNIPGGQPGQYMTTTRGVEGRPALWTRELKVDGRRMTEVRGLWELHNGFLGGPFVALVCADTVSQRVVVAEGFVYNPNGSKRDLLRQLEGALRTVKKVAKP